jgi:hypothetical protein
MTESNNLAKKKEYTRKRSQIHRLSEESGAIDAINTNHEIICQDDKTVTYS